MLNIQDKIYENGKQTQLFSIELHYFRIPKEHWERVIDSAIEMGNTMIAFYVPWFVHEKQNGVFDFSGTSDACCDLIHWLALLEKKKVSVLLRPGPYIYAEMKNLGLPDWLLEEHATSRIMGIEGTKRVASSFAFAFAHNNPTFLRYVKRWLTQVIAVTRAYIGQDQMIKIIQLCNEIPGVDIDDVNPETLQLHEIESHFHAFYEKRYASIERFNEAYKTTYASFIELDPLDMVNNLHYQKDHLAYYYEEYYVRYFQTLKKVYEERGINDVIFVHNAYNPRAISLHIEIRKQIPDLYIGLDNYFSLRSIFDDKSAAYYCEFAAGYAKSAFHHVPFVLEHESGFWLDEPHIYGKDLYIFTIWSFLAGFQGANLYLGHEGENYNGMGMLATTHHWQAPIRMDGTKKDSFYHLQHAFAIIKENEWITQAKTIYTMAFSFPYRSGLIWEKLSEQSEQMFYYLYKCNAACELQDFDHEPTTHTQMVYVSDAHMDEQQQRKLLDYVKDGNTLILVGEVPRVDNRLRPCTTLIDELQLVAYTPTTYDCWGQKITITRTQEEIVQDTYPMCHVDSRLPYEVLATSNNKHILIKMALGKGYIYLLSGSLNYQMESQCHVYTEILQDIHGECNYESKNFRVILKQKEEQTHAFVLNAHPFTMTERIRILHTWYDITIPAYDYKEICL